ncbi:hypothetical protein SNEBB_010482 [Seison nebaliae]|nr:hypothetical protein SNEBB_010482 [Seison nebaliae]
MESKSDDICQIPFDVIESIEKKSSKSFHQLPPLHVKSTSKLSNVWNFEEQAKKLQFLLNENKCECGAGNSFSFVHSTELINPSTKSETSKSIRSSTYDVVAFKPKKAIELIKDEYGVQAKQHKCQLAQIPSLNPSNREEVKQLRTTFELMMNELSKKQDESDDEVNGPTQLHQLMHLVSVEQNIYNLVFHELIRQVAVHCHDKGELLALLRFQYSKLFMKVPEQMKKFHNELLAQKELYATSRKKVDNFQKEIRNLLEKLKELRMRDLKLDEKCRKQANEIDEIVKERRELFDEKKNYLELYKLQQNRLERKNVELRNLKNSWTHLSLNMCQHLIENNELFMLTRLHVNGKNLYEMYQKYNEKFGCVMQIEQVRLFDHIHKLHKRIDETQENRVKYNNLFRNFLFRLKELVEKRNVSDKNCLTVNKEFTTSRESLKELRLKKGNDNVIIELFSDCSHEIDKFQEDIGGEKIQSFLEKVTESKKELDKANLSLNSILTRCTSSKIDSIKNFRMVLMVLNGLMDEFTDFFNGIYHESIFDRLAKLKQIIDGIDNEKMLMKKYESVKHILEEMSSSSTDPSDDSPLTIEEIYENKYNSSNDNRKLLPVNRILIEYDKYSMELYKYLEVQCDSYKEQIEILYENMEYHFVELIQTTFSHSHDFNKLKRMMLKDIDDNYLMTENFKKSFTNMDIISKINENKIELKKLIKIDHDNNKTSIEKAINEEIELLNNMKNINAIYMKWLIDCQSVMFCLTKNDFWLNVPPTLNGENTLKIFPFKKFEKDENEKELMWNDEERLKLMNFSINNRFESKKESETNPYFIFNEQLGIIEEHALTSSHLEEVNKRILFGRKIDELQKVNMERTNCKERTIDMLQTNLKTMENRAMIAENEVQRMELRIRALESELMRKNLKDD